MRSNNMAAFCRSASGSSPDNFKLREPQHIARKPQAFTFVPLRAFHKAGGPKIDFAHGSVASK
jgi:hypothetical protein